MKLLGSWNKLIKICWCWWKIVRQHMRKKYWSNNQRTYVPISVLPFSNSGIGIFSGEGQARKHCRNCGPYLFYFIHKRRWAGLGMSPVIWPPCSQGDKPDKPQPSWAPFLGDPKSATLSSFNIFLSCYMNQSQWLHMAKFYMDHFLTTWQIESEQYRWK